jgi:integrase
MSKRVPKYRPHKTGQARVVLDGHTYYLGLYGTPASKREYARLLALWQAGHLHAAAGAEPAVVEIIAPFLKWVEEQNYHKSEEGEFRMALRPLNHLYADLPARSFGPLELDRVRALMLQGYAHPEHGAQKGLSRGVINKRVDRIRRCFRWAAAKQLIPGQVCVDLKTLESLKRGRTAARETERVLPVARAVVEATLPLLRPMIRDMVKLQLLTGMRPGEVVIMKLCKIDRSGPIWLYQPTEHKNAYRDQERTVYIGADGQEILRRWSGSAEAPAKLEAYLFSPRRATAERYAERRKARATPLWRSHQQAQDRQRKRQPKRQPGERYTTNTYARSIAQAIKRHNAKCPAGEAIPHWHPHQLRHQFAKETKRAGGLDVARILTGHKSLSQADWYGGPDDAKAKDFLMKHATAPALQRGQAARSRARAWRT